MMHQIDPRLGIRHYKSSSLRILAILSMVLVLAGMAAPTWAANLSEPAVKVKKSKKAAKPNITEAEASVPEGVTGHLAGEPCECGEAEDASGTGPVADCGNADDKNGAITPCPRAAVETTAETKEAADDDSDAADEGSTDEKTDSPKTHTVTTEPMHVQVALSGTFASARKHEILVDPDNWSTWTIATVAEHGTLVSKGDVLVTFDTEDIDEAIENLRDEIELAELSLETSKLELAAAEKSLPETIKWLQRSRRIADEDRKNFLDIYRPLSHEGTERSLEMAKHNLEYQEEEVRQLEKMYQADDLTEETEEIVLTRARRALERAKFSYEVAQIDYKITKEFTQPRTDESNAHNWREALLQTLTSEQLLPLVFKREQLSFQRAEKALQRQHEKLDELLADRERMTIRSPACGIVYHGRLRNGKFTTTSTAAMLQQRSSVSAKTPFMTIVRQQPLVVYAELDEDELRDVVEGTEGYAQPTGFPTLKLRTIVSQVDAVPTPCGYFVRMDVGKSKDAQRVMPGMTCDVTLRAYEADEAVVIPEDALETDKRTGDHYVYLPSGKKDKEPRKKQVRIGHRADKKVEILDGLEAGDVILAEPPKDE